MELHFKSRCQAFLNNYKFEKYAYYSLIIRDLFKPVASLNFIEYVDIYAFKILVSVSFKFFF